jgi:hypothetical protein
VKKAGSQEKVGGTVRFSLDCPLFKEVFGRELSKCPTGSIQGGKTFLSPNESTGIREKHD